MDPYLSLSFGGTLSGRPRAMAEIVSLIAEQIRAGGPALRGCRLPPIRVLSHRLGVSKNTVNAAYDELQARALVESRGKRGLYVAAAPTEHSAPDDGPRAPAPRFKPNPSLVGSRAVSRGPLELGSVFIDPRLLPTERLAACFRSALKRPGLSHEYAWEGYLPLRREIAKRLATRGVDADPDHVVTTVGSQQVLDVVLRALERPTIATESPAYYLGKALFERSGADVFGLPLDPFVGVDLVRWEELLSARRPGLVYVTTHFQNPSGYSYSSREMLSLLAWSAKLGFGILEDDWGSDMLSYSEFTPSLRALGGSNVLYMNSFTKKVLPSLRVGYVLGNEHTAPGLLASKRLAIGGAPVIGEAALYEFIEQGYYDTYLRALQPELDLRYRHCLDLLRRHMPEGVRWTTPGGGPSLWLECPRSVSLHELVERLARNDVALTLSENAFFGTPHLHGFRLGYAFLTPGEMERAIAALAGELCRALEKAA
jgi:DNA-binding transcriptional MocR family regulator